MRVLVTTATDDVTKEIGARIAAVLDGRGHEVELCCPDDVIDVEAYDVVVLGSAVDHGHWRDDARLLVIRAESELASRPVWLFSSEPASDDPVVDVADVMSATHAFEHHLFRRSRRDVGAVGVATAVIIPGGESEPWDDVDAWAVSIADSISSG